MKRKMYGSGFQTLSVRIVEKRQGLSNKEADEINAQRMRVKGLEPEEDRIARKKAEKREQVAAEHRRRDAESRKKREVAQAALRGYKENEKNPKGAFSKIAARIKKAWRRDSGKAG